MQTLEALQSLLACALAQIEPPVCRSFINPGANAPHDACGRDGDQDGQLWVANLTTSAGWPTTTSDPITCATPFSDAIELGIVRCANSVLQDVEILPDPEDVTADAVQQQADKYALKIAILCCWEVEGMDMLPPLWEPIEPQGGCVGGTWTLFVRDATCICPEES